MFKKTAFPFTVAARSKRLLVILSTRSSCDYTNQPKHSGWHFHRECWTI